MGVKVRRLVMQSVSETDGIGEILGEFPHDRSSQSWNERWSGKTYRTV